MSDVEILQIADGKTIYDSPATPFVASFVGENNPLPGRVIKVGKTGAVLETAFGQLRGGNPKGLKVGDRAILFVRPESISLGKGAADATISSQVQNVAFEGNVSHIFMKGAGKKDMSVTVGRHGGAEIPEKGSKAAVNYDPSYAVVLPEGKMARE